MFLLCGLRKAQNRNIWTEGKKDTRGRLDARRNRCFIVKHAHKKTHNGIKDGAHRKRKAIAVD